MATAGHNLHLLMLEINRAFDVLDYNIESGDDIDELMYDIENLANGLLPEMIDALLRFQADVLRDGDFLETPADFGAEETPIETGGEWAWIV